MLGQCNNCFGSTATKQVMDPTIGSFAIDVCTICATILLTNWGFVDVTLSPTCASPTTLKEFLANHKGYTAGFDKGYIIKLKECECGNKDKPMNSQLHSDWCDGFKLEF